MNVLRLFSNEHPFLAVWTPVALFCIVIGLMVFSAGDHLKAFIIIGGQFYWLIATLYYINDAKKKYDKAHSIYGS